MYFRLLLIWMFSLALGKVMAQDPHYSQYFLSPVYTNPANTGLFSGKYRFTMNYRNQWSSVTTPYTTMSGGVDMPLTRKRNGKNYYGGGLTLMRDKAGDGGYGFIEGMVSGSYFFSLNKRYAHYLGAGLMIGAAETSVDYDRLRFPDQYNGSYYDPDLPHYELFGQGRRTYADLSAGLVWSLSLPRSESYYLGFSVFHLNKPDQSLLEGYHAPLDPRWSVQAAMTYPFSNNWDLLPSIYYDRQGKHRECIAGVMGKYDKYSTPTVATILYAGLYTRWNDAAIMVVGLEYQYVNVGISYDINYSKLRKASYFRGGLELGLQFILQKPQGQMKRDVTCPIF